MSFTSSASVAASGINAASIASCKRRSSSSLEHAEDDEAEAIATARALLPLRLPASAVSAAVALFMSNFYDRYDWLSENAKTRTLNPKRTQILKPKA